MLTSPTQLRDTLVALARDVGGLPGRRCALVGFRDPNPKRVDDNLRSLGGLPDWALIDARGDAAARLATSFASAPSASKPALLVDATVKVPTDVSLLVRAVHDSRDSVRWADGTQTALPASLILYVVAVGAQSIEELPLPLQRIDFMTFVERAR